MTDKATLSKLSGRPALADEVYERLKAWIMDHVRQPDDRVNIDALARALDVSPTPVREALVRLEAEGFVVKEPQRGYSVTPLLGRQQLLDLYELRLLLEPWAAGRAAEVRTDADIVRLHDELASCPQAPEGDGYAVYRAIVDHDQRFHDLLLEIAGNDEVRAAFARTNCHLHLFRLTYGRGMGAQALDEHAALAAAIEARRPDDSEAAMRAHLERSRDRLLAGLL